ncbi:MAG TPA: hypothetical protein VIZ28_19305 [Chitinophagaceae bacterium]
MWQAWTLCGAGIVFCLTGAWMFYKNVYEAKGKTLPAVLVMIAGVVLISLGTAKYFHLLN